MLCTAQSFIKRHFNMRIRHIPRRIRSLITIFLLTVCTFIHTHPKKQKKNKHTKNIYIAYSRPNEICSVAVWHRQELKLCHFSVSLLKFASNGFFTSMFQLSFISFSPFANCTVCQPFNVFFSGASGIHSTATPILF